MPKKKQVTTQKGGKKNRKIGRAARHNSHKIYVTTHRREKNKLKRIVRSNGRTYAESYAAGVGMSAVLTEMLRRRRVRIQEAR